MDIVLFVAALLPAIVLMVYIYRKDPSTHEPVGLVARVFFLGALSGIVAGLIESFAIEALEASIPPGFLLLFIEYFICVAAVEEACKFFCLNTVKNNPAFDHVFDAIVYAVAAALGFAALENVFYVMDGGLETALLRAVLSVPGHAADGVLMGVFYGFARRRELHGNKAGARTYYWLAFLLPTIEHGFYDAALSTESDLLAIFAMLFDLAFIAFAFYLVKRAAAKDEPLRPQVAQPFGQAGMPTQPTAGQPVGQPLQAGMPMQQAVQQQPAPQTTHLAWEQPNPTWYCGKCGKPNTGNFCTSCGTRRMGQ